MKVGVYNEDGEPLGFDYVYDDAPDPDDFYDDDRYAPDDYDAEEWREDDDEFPRGTYVTHPDFPGCALVVKETCEGWARVVMVGDDRVSERELEDLTKIEREAFCGECGQLGCGHDGYDRSEAADEGTQ